MIEIIVPIAVVGMAMMGLSLYCAWCEIGRLITRVDKLEQELGV